MHNNKYASRKWCGAGNYLNSIFFVGDEIDARLHSGISTLAQNLILEPVDICGFKTKSRKF